MLKNILISVGSSIVVAIFGVVLYTQVLSNTNFAGQTHLKGLSVGADGLTVTDAGAVNLGSGALTLTGTTTIANKLGVGSTTPYGFVGIVNTTTFPSLIVDDTTSPDASPFIIAANGDVGIGTSSPMTKLSVKGPLNIASASGDVYYSSFSHENSDFLQTVFGTNAQWGVTIGTTNRLQLTNAGRFGISSSTPAGKLAITASGASGATTAFALADSNNIQKVTILDNGNTGIGTTTPGFKLVVSSGASATTTPTFAELGISSSKTCINLNTNAGGPASLYIVGTSVVVEANYCR